jgi:hypothetical protein
MGEISKPDTNPIIPAVLNLLFAGGVGYFMMGQQKKGIISIIATVLLSMCFGIGMIIPLITAYDAYLLGQKLQSGQSIGENENGLEFLNAIFKD